ncbi:MAG: ATP-dependent DNA helicase RecG [Fusobacteria bacterium]|nr:ATP-dependent DNA helicase RecG [Fusobacteriota bacterium]
MMIKEYEILYHDIKEIKIKNLGEKTLDKLKKYGITRLIDFLYHFPRTYEDRSNYKKIRDLLNNEYISIKGEVIEAKVIRTRTYKSMFKIVVSDGYGTIEAVWFKMPYLVNTIKVGMEVLLNGTVKKEYIYKMVNPGYQIIEDNGDINLSIIPVYTLPQSISQTIYIKIIKQVIEYYIESLHEIFPIEFIDKFNLPSRIETIKKIHFPEKLDEVYNYKRRIATEEIFILEMGILQKRFEYESINSVLYNLEDKKNLVKKYLESLKFELTRAQKKVISEIYNDLNSGKISNRLIQGDVGSGKTVVAIILLLYMIDNGYQGVLMAPTEILAEQHFLGNMDIFNNLGIKIEILTGSVKGKKRKQILDELEQGVINLIIGTHALIEDNVKFKKLGLVVIDEQHKFGVEQRKKLREKGIISNIAVMSATPIPRSLALSIYGDLDVSIIDELPPNRKDIKTKWINSENLKEKMFNFLKTKLEEGRQIYFVTPLIEETETGKWYSTEDVYNMISEKGFGKYNIGILHGKMKSEEKDAIMTNFKKHKLDILISTTVIEVGVDVPNAAIMVIIDSNKFGLSQLHQLRGRVGRGEHQSYCFLVTNTTNEVSIERMKIMEKTNDGFKIAEEDLKLRKSGEIFGKKQSGISDIKYVDVVRDIKLIKNVRDEVINYLKKTKGVVENPILKIEITEKFNKDKENNNE